MVTTVPMAMPRISGPGPSDSCILSPDERTCAGSLGSADWREGALKSRGRWSRNSREDCEALVKGHPGTGWSSTGTVESSP